MFENLYAQASKVHGLITFGCEDATYSLLHQLIDRPFGTHLAEDHCRNLLIDAEADVVRDNRRPAAEEFAREAYFADSCFGRCNLRTAGEIGIRKIQEGRPACDILKAVNQKSGMNEQEALNKIWTSFEEIGWNP